MEKFEFDDERNLEIFSGFVGRAKETLTTLIDDIKENIRDYQQKIEDTSKEIDENEVSREKCAREITKMEGKISEIKDAIDNVENTYKKIADAYSSTSKGDTRDLYSEIIDGAKSNCEKDVERNRSEIARLNSDIEAIKNNITEFNKVIAELNRDLDNYNLEMFKYNKSLEYMEKFSEKANEDLEEISSRKDTSTKKVDDKIIKKGDSKSVSTKRSGEPKSEVELIKELRPTRRSSSDKKSTSSLSSTQEEANEPVKKDDLKKTEPVLKVEEAPKEEPIIKHEVKETVSFEDTLRQIYDLTGYKPNEKETEKNEVKPSMMEEAPKEEKRVYSDNLDSLFTATQPSDNTKAVSPTSSFMESDFSNWEKILNSPSKSMEFTRNDEPFASSSIDNDMENAVNQLLSPYGTNFARLKGLVATTISYKDGSRIPFNLNLDDVSRAVNAIDGTDLKMMKTVGPEITLLRKIKSMKEDR